MSFQEVKPELTSLKNRDRYYFECDLIDGDQYSLCEVWEEIKEGTKLYLVRDNEEKSDMYSVAVVFGHKKRQTEEFFMIGHLSKCDRTEDVAKILDMDWNDDGKFFSCKVAKKENKDEVGFRLRLVIRILKR